MYIYFWTGIYIYIYIVLYAFPSVKRPCQLKYHVNKRWYRLVLWHINHCRLFNSKSSSYIYIKYI